MSVNSKNKASDTEETPLKPLAETEREFLSSKAQLAKQAFLNSSLSLFKHLWRKIDLRAATRDHPWKSTGAAALAGFAVANQWPAPSRGEKRVSTPPDKPSPPPFMSVLLMAGVEIAKKVLPPLILQRSQSSSPLPGEGEGDSPPS